MIQASLGGYNASLNNTDVFYDAPNTYYEPSFNIMFPLQFSIIDCNNVYILFRIRTDDTGNNFEAFDSNYNTRFQITTTDANSGELISSSFSYNYYHSGWNSSYSPYFLNIQVNNSKVIDCLIVDTQNNDIITFRTIIQREDTAFGYLDVYNRYTEQRSNISLYGLSGVLTLDKGGLYVIITPFDGFTEVDNNYDFSYPNNVVFYKMNNNFVKEEFQFSITDYNPAIINGNIQIISVPNFHRAGIILIDGILQNILLTSKLTGYIDLEAVGLISGQINTFRLYLTPDIGVGNLINA